MAGLYYLLRAFMYTQRFFILFFFFTHRFFASTSTRTQYLYIYIYVCMDYYTYKNVNICIKPDVLFVLLMHARVHFPIVKEKKKRKSFENTFHSQKDDNMSFHFDPYISYTLCCGIFDKGNRKRKKLIKNKPTGV